MNVREAGLYLSALAALLLKAVGCSKTSTVVMSMGTNATVRMTIDGSGQVRELVHSVQDGSVNVRGKMKYSGGKVALVRFCDAQGKTLCETSFDTTSTSSTSPDPKFEYHGTWSTSPAGRDEHLIWRLNGEMLFGSNLTYDHQGKLKQCEVLGPGGVPVITNRWD